MLGAAAVAALVAGALLTARRGRFRATSTSSTTSTVPTAWHRIVSAVPSAIPGERVTLVQFSSAFCAPCRATRQLLGVIAETTPGAAHVEVDAEQHLQLVRELGVIRTPTTLVIDREGAEVARAAGVPQREQVLAALAEVSA